MPLKRKEAHTCQWRSRNVMTDSDPDPATSDSTDDEALTERAYTDNDMKRLTSLRRGGPSLLRDVFDISAVLTDGAAAMVDDSFLRCFNCRHSEPWNWNFYLFPAWCLGVVIRYGFLFWIRLAMLLIINVAIVVIFIVLTSIMRPSPLRKAIERRLVQALSFSFLMSWGAVVRFHGPAPVPAANRLWVANHSSMIDYGIICSYRPFAVIMQLHGGWIRFIQTRLLASLGCLWFNRTDLKDRQIVGERMKAHVSQPDSTPLLIFPEGTCVNNEYTVLFKRGAFDMGCTVCPIAIKYNKMFVDGFWNSKRQSFGQYLVKLMTSWALVCDVWFLEPQNRREGESVDEFASRVQGMIADKAGLRIVPWDGYLKYYQLGLKNPGLIEKRRSVYAECIKHHLPGGGTDSVIPGGKDKAKDRKKGK